MKKILSIIIFVVLIIVLLLLFVFNNKKDAEEVIVIDEQEQTERERVIKEDNGRPERTITVKHQYVDGMHTYVGNIDVPTPCHGLEQDVRTSELTNTTTIDFTVTQPANEQVCQQVITPTPFSISFEAPKDHSVVFTLNGEVLGVNQYDVPPAQKMDSVDIMIKG